MYTIPFIVTVALSVISTVIISLQLLRLRRDKDRRLTLHSIIKLGGVLSNDEAEVQQLLQFSKPYTNPPPSNYNERDYKIYRDRLDEKIARARRIAPISEWELGDILEDEFIKDYLMKSLTLPEQRNNREPNKNR